MKSINMNTQHEKKEDPIWKNIISWGNIKFCNKDH